MTAQSQLLAELGCEIGDLGTAVTDAKGRTSVPGVWAAGNVADAMASVIHAAAAGSAAAMDINVDLVREDTEAAVAAMCRS
jgi:thioredoxin reductase